MVHHLTIYYIPILVATLVTFSVGSFWFSPALFGRTWNALREKPLDNFISPRSLGIFFAALLLFNGVMSYLVEMTHTFGMTSGVLMGVFVWTGFCVPAVTVISLFEKQRFLVWAITSGYLFALCVISGALQSLWR